MKKIMSGNEAIARGVVEAGTHVASGYPGTPSSEVIDTLLKEYSDYLYVEWSINEKVAAELAIAAAWSGLRAIATMKMSGMNVASDSVLSAIYSGTKGGLLFYVADDPGVYAGMVEQDTRNYAVMAPCPCVEPSTPSEAKKFVSLAFDLSEKFEIPIILRGTTVLAHSEEPVELGDIKSIKVEPNFEKDIAKYTKAGRKIVIEQHKMVLEKLEKIREEIEKSEYYTIDEGNPDLLVITSGSASGYVYDLAKGKAKILRLWLSWPIPRQLILEHMSEAEKVLIVEEIDPVIEREVRAIAQIEGLNTKILGKMTGDMPSYDEYTHKIVAYGLRRLGIDVDIPSSKIENIRTFRRPITFCHGCPHRVTYYALIRALREFGLDPKRNVIVTGDIGCTILAMNRPYEMIWTELSMGASVGLARGFLRAGEKIVIAALGDSTFFHATIPQIINAYLTKDNVKIVILDNSWTAMTGHQPTPTSPNVTAQILPEKILEGIGIKTKVVDPYDIDATIEAMKWMISQDGPAAVVARRECSLQAMRRGIKGIARVLENKCTGCKACLTITACPALRYEDSSGKMRIIPELCNGCGLCAYVCPFNAIEVEPPKGE